MTKESPYQDPFSKIQAMQNPSTQLGHGTSSPKESDLFNSLRIFALVFIISLLFVALTVHVRPEGIYSSLFDDAMISFRYARNIADGIGPYWNLEDRVEGFTNPLWTYLMSAVYSASGSSERLAPLFVQIICSFTSINCRIFLMASKIRDRAISQKYPPTLSSFLFRTSLVQYYFILIFIEPNGNGGGINNTFSVGIVLISFYDNFLLKNYWQR